MNLLSFFTWLFLCFWSLLAFASTTGTDQVEILKSEYPSSSVIISTSNHSSTTKQFNAGKTLGYVTPWNPKGKDLTLKYRDKFDIVSPVWYTLNSVLDEGEEPRYEINGGPTSTDDESWLQKLRETEESQSRVTIAPRFFFDSWVEDDFLGFLSRVPSSVNSLRSSILDVVEENHYDGVVLESSAIWVLVPLIHSLGEELRKRDKIFVLVLPPLRDPSSHSSIQKVNDLILKTAKEVARSVDHFSIMTYDASGAGGTLLDPESSSLALARESPLRKLEYSNLRQPGPNSPLNFISKNVELFSFKDLEDSVEFGFNSNTMLSQNEVGLEDSLKSKLLMGLPLYGYTYPIAWVSTVTGHSFPRKPPLSPIKSKDQDIEAQSKARASADKRNEAEPYKDLIPVLRAAGDPLVHHQVMDIMKKRPLIRLDESSQEAIADYTDILPSERGGSPHNDEPCYYRSFFPTAHTMKKRIEVVQEAGKGIGLALWDVGQAGDWLLDGL